MNVRLSDEAREALTALAKRDGDSETGWIERAIREKARKLGLWKD
jgi:predicted HicB family RNase H-like nuclease